MKWKTETILRAISAVCQFYYASFSATSLYLALTLTLPDYCADNKGLQTFMKFLIWFIFLNMMGNFFCIIYKSKLSIVPSPPNITRDLAQLKVHQGHFSSSFTNNDLLQKSDMSTNNNEEICSKVQPFAPGNNVHIDHSSCNDKSIEPKNSSDEFIHIYSAKNASSEILGGWHRCKDCLAMSPPRGKHCPLCKHCILKRDHHCYFVGCCIGFHNQRFFVCFCLYGGLGGLYSLWLTSFYLYNHYEALQTWGLPAFLGPFAVVHWALGYTSGANLGMVLFWWWSLLTSAMGCCYGCGQMFLVARGQTNYEFFQNIRTYRGTVMGNIHSVFGKCWPLGFFIPSPFLGYVGDGANWDDLLGNWKNL
ncbi:palmitoyltransferase [Plakobranchus ocellatus]|uniref:Palmitoyltransferase n=1 Tax=Plakobranchus ocellatus TaxID=259542 RepID=A0AAV4DLM9_9GAST|nr:palmitoyltransferase [Plakobranchus ocellatus]